MEGTKTYFPNFILLDKDVENTTCYLLSTSNPKRKDILAPRKVRKTQSKIKEMTKIKDYTIENSLHDPCEL